MASRKGLRADRKQTRLRAGVLVLSLANLVYWPVWQQLFDLPSPYFAQPPPPPIYLAAAALGVGLLAAALFLSIAFLRAVGGRARAIADGVLPAVWLLPFGLLWVGAREALGDGVGAVAVHAAGAGMLAVFCYAGVFQRARWLALAEVLSLVFLPFVAVTAARLLWGVAQGPAPPEAIRLAPVLPATAGQPRVVWIVMDEFDYRLAFESRPASVELPAFDRLRGESLFATRASAPAWRTLLSMPALINGRPVIAASPASERELLVGFAGEQGVGQGEAPWSQLPNLFSRIRDRGGNVGVVGFYHPYCLLFPTHLSACAVAPFLTAWGEPSLGEALLSQWAHLLKRVPPFAALGLADGVRHWSDDLYMRGLRSSLLTLNRQLEASARDLLRRSDLQLMLVHLAVPHPPGVHDRRTDRTSTAPDVNYLDNLELADRTLAELRSLAEQAGSWQETTWIITSDHWWKSNFWASEPGWTAEEQRLQIGEEDRRIPFIVKLAGARDAVELSDGLSTIVSAKLIETLWDRGFASHRGLAAWLAKQQVP